MDEEQEEQPRRSKKGPKKEKKRKQQDSDGEEVVEEEEEDVPIPELGDHPLDKNQAPRIHGMSTDWGILRDKVHQVGYGFTREIAASVAEFTEGEKGEKVGGVCFSASLELTEGCAGLGANRYAHARASGY